MNISGDINIDLGGGGDGEYQVGSAVYDITGPPYNVQMMGYGQAGQRTRGIHLRLRSRAFVIVHPATGARTAIAVCDLDVIAQAIKTQVIQRLRQLYGDAYSNDNVLLCATHTHSGPAGYCHYSLYNGLGFVEQNFQTICDGIFQSIVRAHRNVIPARIYINRENLHGASINRSPSAYELNPNELRDKYDHDVDKDMWLLRFDGLDGTRIGCLNFFAVHGTSMSAHHKYISGDNKGYAAQMFERMMGTDYTSDNNFVAAFANSNEGDVTPNVCLFTKDVKRKSEGEDDFDDTRINGVKQLNIAQQLYNTANTPVRGPVDYRHTTADYENIILDPEIIPQEEIDMLPAHQRRTFPGAIGHSFAAGAADGKSGWFCFKAGQKKPTPIIAHAVYLVLGYPEKKIVQCHCPKAILFYSGKDRDTRRFPLTPHILSVQIIRIGQVALLGFPGEATTMAGRRIAESVKAALAPLGVEHVIIVGLSNDYSGYCATYEEYQAQLYEGGFTLYGPATQLAHQQMFVTLARAMVQGRQAEEGPDHPVLPKSKTWQYPDQTRKFHLNAAKITRVWWDVKKEYHAGQSVKVMFHGSNPNENLRIQSTYMEVQKLIYLPAESDSEPHEPNQALLKSAADGGEWSVVARDWDWETRIKWSHILSLIWTTKIKWVIPRDQVPGIYRIAYYSDRRHGETRVGYSSPFMVKRAVAATQ